MSAPLDERAEQAAAARRLARAQAVAERLFPSPRFEGRDAEARREMAAEDAAMDRRSGVRNRDGSYSE